MHPEGQKSNSEPERSRWYTYTRYGNLKVGLRMSMKQTNHRFHGKLIKVTLNKGLGSPDTSRRLNKEASGDRKEVLT